MSRRQLASRITRRHEEPDVLIIGAGAGGGAVAGHLSRAGIKVTCLEQGDWVHPTEHPHYHDEWEMEVQRSWAYEPNKRELPEDYPTSGNSAPYMFNAVGGSTRHYAGAWPRFKPIDFRKGTEHGVEGTIDWPIAYEDLAPYYELNDATIGVSRFIGDPANPGKTPGHAPALPAGKLGHKMAKGFQSLGWHWWPADNAVLSRPVDGRLGCNACGPCLAGCPRGAIASTDETYWPQAILDGADLRVNARVERIDTRNGRAKGATYIDRVTGERHQVNAGIVIVAANAIGTPRLLLMSAQDGHPDGLANSNGMVGRHMMFHSWAFEDFWFEEPIEDYKGNLPAVLYCQSFYDTSSDRDYVNGFSLQVGRSHGAAFTAMGANSGKSSPWGAGHRQHFNEHFGHHILVYVQGEDLPVATNRVTLDPAVTDSSGLPAAHIHYDLHDNDRRLIEFGRERALEAANAAGGVIDHGTLGVWGVDVPPPGWHMMGTCRIGNTPEDSVTNKWHQTWDVPNLFITDASSMPTSAAVNPTSTLQAMALRCADYIVRNHREILEQKATPANAEAPAM